jgi:hypothetical protein
VLGARSSGVAAEREARVVEMVCWRLGKWRVQGLMCRWRLGLRVYARGGSREEVLGDGGTCELTCCRGELRAVVKNISTKFLGDGGPKIEIKKKSRSCTLSTR